MQYSVTCESCGQVFLLPTVTTEQVRKILIGEDIEKVLPDFTPEQRELVLTQTCEKCYIRLLTIKD